MAKNLFIITILFFTFSFKGFMWAGGSGVDFSFADKKEIDSTIIELQLLEFFETYSLVFQENETPNVLESEFYELKKLFDEGYYKSELEKQESHRHIYYQVRDKVPEFFPDPERKEDSMEMADRVFLFTFS